MSHWCILCCTKNHTGHFINEYSSEHTYKKGRLHWQWILRTSHCTDAWSIEVKQKASQTWHVINGYSVYNKTEAPLHWQQLLHMAQVYVLLMPVETIIQKRQMDHLKLPARLLWHVRCCNKTKRIPPNKTRRFTFTRNNSHDISSETVNTCNSRLTASQMCGFLHVRGPAAGAKPLNI